MYRVMMFERYGGMQWFTWLLALGETVLVSDEFLACVNEAITVRIEEVAKRAPRSTAGGETRLSERQQARRDGAMLIPVLASAQLRQLSGNQQKRQGYRYRPFVGVRRLFYGIFLLREMQEVQGPASSHVEICICRGHKC